MEKYETAEAISDSAADWVARVDRSDGEKETMAELEVWLAGDDRRKGAYFRAQSAWAMLDRARVLAGGGDNRIEERAGSGWLSRRRILAGGSAAVAASVIGFAGVTFWPDGGLQIDTDVGEIRRVPLRDGSIAAVNTQTQLAVILHSETRKIRLDRGEAWFQVAKDRSRPFVVEAGDVRVRAVGTAFSVRRTGSGADVRVTEGVVEVWSTGSEQNVRRVKAGERTLVDAVIGPQHISQAGAENERTLAWRTGQLIFDGDTLGAAAAEFNRYNVRQVSVADAELASEKFVGRFRTNEPDAFARAAADILGARVQIADDAIILSKN
jgi:transmembrane sensor